MKLKLVLTGLLFSALAFAGDITGKWNGSVPGQDGQEMTLNFDFKAENGKITGKVTSPMGEIPISEGSINGDDVSFTTEFNDMKIVHKGKVSGDEMKLKVEMGDHEMDMTLKRAGAPSTN